MRRGFWEALSLNLNASLETFLSVLRKVCWIVGNAHRISTCADFEDKKT